MKWTLSRGFLVATCLTLLVQTALGGATAIPTFACMSLEGDLARAKQAQQTVAPLARLIYNFGEPGCGAHQRMKVAKWLLGEISSPVFRRPVRPLPEAEVQRLREGLRAIGLKPIN